MNTATQDTGLWFDPPSRPAPPKDQQPTESQHLRRMLTREPRPVVVQWPNGLRMLLHDVTCAVEVTGLEMSSIYCSISSHRPTRHGVRFSWAGGDEFKRKVG